MNMRDFKLDHLGLKDLILPTAVFMGGVVLGRLVGLKPVLRGAVATLAIAEAARDAGLAGAFESRRAPRKRAVARAVRKRSTHKKSARKAP